jgi:hypothetical protein
MTIARPDKTVGRIVLGPRLLGTDYVRIVARADGSGHIQRYDKDTGSWGDAPEGYTFCALWSAPAALDSTRLALL